MRRKLTILKHCDKDFPRQASICKISVITDEAQSVDVWGR